MRAEPGVSVARDRAYYQERRRAQARAARFRRRLAAATVAVLLLLVIGIGVGFAGSADRLAGGVTIGGVDVGGLTVEEARRELADRYARVASQPVVFVYGEQRFAVTPAQAGVAPDWDVVLAEALDEGDGFLLFRGLKRLSLKLSGHDVSLAGVVGGPAVAAQVDRLAAEIDRPARDAALVLEGLQPIVRPATDGLRLDRLAAATLVGEAMAAFSRGGPTSLPVVAVEPDVRAPDLAEAAEQARVALSGPVELAHRRRTFTLEPRDIAELLVLPAAGKSELTIGGKPAERYFARIADALDRKPADAGFTLTAGGSPRVVPAKEGRVLDREASAKALLAAVLVAAPGERRAALVVETAQPDLTTAEARAMGIEGVVGAFTTVYGGDPNRLHNVRLVSELIDDHLIAPGQTFSFNETTGERNAEKGFLEAPVIINGELQTGLGGGVCQVSTTVFNAAFEAGLSIEERTNHALYISHYPTGRDATVNYPDTDLRFTNDTGHWLWLRAFVGASELTVVLYGSPVDRRVEIERTPLEVVGPPKVERILDPTLDKGTRIVEDLGEPARSVSVRRIVYDADGNVLYDTVWFSSYVSEPRIVRIGTKPPPVVEEEPAQDGTKPGGGEQAGAGAGAEPGAGDGGTGAGAGGSGSEPGSPGGASGGEDPGSGAPPAPPA
jgi:vancomycin resistance protein YoaR